MADERSLVRSFDREVRLREREHQLTSFVSYWALALQTLGDHTVIGWFKEFAEGYGNLAVVTEGLIVDIEGDDAADAGHVSVYAIRDIASLDLHIGEVPDISGTTPSSLTLRTNAAAQPAGPWWTTDNTELHRDLRQFAAALTSRISAYRESRE